MRTLNLRRPEVHYPSLLDNVLVIGDGDKNYVAFGLTVHWNTLNNLTAPGPRALHQEQLVMELDQCQADEERIEALENAAY